MVFERYTENARHVIVLASKEARTRRHDHLGTEHLLLGPIHQGQDPAAHVLIALGADLDRARRAVLTIAPETSRLT